MKKELLTEQDYLDAHLKEFEVICQGEKVKGIIFVDDNKNVFLLQNSLNGCTPNNKEWNKFGYNFSWCNLCKGEFTYSALNNVTIEEWKPKFGEVVIAYNDEEDEIKQEHIFLFKKDGLYHCVTSSYQDIEYYHQNDVRLSYDVSVFNFIRPIEEPKLELNWEEARQIIADAKGVKSENVNLKIK